MISSVKRKTNQFFEKSLFEQTRRKIKQKTFVQINKISISFDSKNIRFKKFVVHFIFDKSRIVELNFDEKFILFTFFAEFSLLMKAFFFRIHISATFNENFEIVDYFIFYTSRVASFFRFCLNQIMVRHSELQKRDFFFDFFSYVAFMIDIIDYFRVRESKSYKKAIRDFYYKMKWQLTVNEKINFFLLNGTWALVDKSLGQKILIDK